MNGLGKFKDAFAAHDSMNAYCDSFEDGCESCKYSLLNEMTGIPCCMFWMADNCLIEPAPKIKTQSDPNSNKTGAETVVPVKMLKKIVIALGNMIELNAGRKPNESEATYNRRRSDITASADSTLGELEDFLLKGATP